MGKPAARIGDMHECPVVSPGGVPHGGGPIVGPGSTTVFIEGLPAATTGDTCTCVGEPDKIVSGSTGVFIEGKASARMGDQCAHGGVVVGGSGTVEIGERVGRLLYSRPDDENKDNNEGFVEPTQEAKNRIINKAIQECIRLLERKLKLLEERDRKTMEDFKKWFGWEDEGAVDLILNRIKRVLEITKVLTLGDFGEIGNDHERMTSFASTYPRWEFYSIQLGDFFWDNKNDGGKTNASTIAHEVSHIEYVGLTRDFDYGIEQCQYLAENSPWLSLFNAESFEYFIKG